MEFIKYVGRFGAVTVEGETLKRGVPAPVPDHIAQELLQLDPETGEPTSEDYVLSSEEEMKASVDPTGSRVVPEENKPVTEPVTDKEVSSSPLEAARNATPAKGVK